MLKIGGPIPIFIRPTFWLFAAFIGFLYSQSLFGTITWVAIIFVSVLFHEFGHALAAILFGKKPRIELVALGGITVHDGQNLPYWKQFVITLNGPFFGFVLALIAWAVGKIPLFTAQPYALILHDVFVVNLFWTVVNLIPVLPMDGGQLLRIVLEGIFGAKGFGYSLIVGLIVAVLISLFFFLMQSFLVGALFFLFAYQCFELWRSTRNIEDVDRKEDLRELFMKAEEALVSGQVEEAVTLFYSLREQAKKGVLWATATQQLAILEHQLGRRDRVYPLLLEVQEDLSDQGACILHEVAFEAKNYPLVAKLSSRVFQIQQEADVALRSASAFAQIGQVKPAIGWLYAAIEHGFESMRDFITRELFDPIRNDPQFKKFIDHLGQAS